jgi:hypothetical protein
MIAASIRAIGDALKGQPVILALVLLNAIFLIAFALLLREVGQNIARRDAAIAELIKGCNK